MNTNPLADVVTGQYEKWMYPEPIRDLPAWLANNWQWFDPSHAHRMFWPDRDYRPDLDILVAGCGSNQAAVFAYTNPGATVVAIDVSAPSLAHHRYLKEKYQLRNLELHRLPIEDVGTLGRDFDLIVSTGVLHHLADPRIGMQALAGCLRPDGVAAIMLYARYGRIGVEMLQAVFRELGLRQDEASLSVVRAALASLPQDHPVNGYLAVAPDLSFDAGLVDTFLHGRDRSYTVADCLDLVASAGLVFQEWFLKSPYYPPAGSGDLFCAQVAALPEERQWSIMERVNSRNGCHFFTACRPDRPRATYRVDFAGEAFLDNVPVFRYRCGFRDGEAFRYDWTMALDAVQQTLLRLVDGRRTIREIIAAAGALALGRSPRELEAFARTLFRSLVQRDFLSMGLPVAGGFSRLAAELSGGADEPSVPSVAASGAADELSARSGEPSGMAAKPTGPVEIDHPAATSYERGRPSICLTMIVRNEAHIIHELIGAIAAHIDHWVIVDTGSTDGTQDVIRRLMAERGIPGELFERPWRDFGSNRSEALALAQGRCDYLWMMDADDTVVGTLDFSGLDADGVSLRLCDGTTYWRLQLFRDGVPWCYAGVLHEVAVCDLPHTTQRLDGDYRIESRRLGERNRDPDKYARDAEVLQAEVDRNPDDRRAVFYLAQSYFDAGDFALARKWYARRAEMGGWDEEVFWSLYRGAQAMERRSEPWPDVQDAYLRAWTARPSRAEPLYAIAVHYRLNGEYQLGHLFAERAAGIPLPADDALFVPTDVYEWRALDEQAVCGSWIGRHAETLAICERLLARGDLPDEDRQRIAANRDLAAIHLRRSVPDRVRDPAPDALPDIAADHAVDPATASASTHPELRAALARRLLRRAVASGEVRLPAVPAMLEECLVTCLRSFEALGVEFDAKQVADLQQALEAQLAAAFAASPRSEVVITYESPVGLTVNWHVKPKWSTVRAAYDTWVASRQPPYFGTEPDARVMSLAAEAASPAACPVLDLGAGTGRNALALARRGHPVDAVEVAASFAAILRAEAERESLAVRVFERDLFATHEGLRCDYGLVLLSEVASDFRTTTELRRMFEIGAACLAPGGALVFNAFLPRGSYTPDAAARQFGEQVYTSIFTYPEVAAAAWGLPLEMVTDHSAHDYEKQNLPDGAWPPTSWYADWVSGLDVFDVPRHESPIELRWLVYRKTRREIG